MTNKKILTLISLLLFLFLLVGCFPKPTPSNEAPIITSVPITTATVGEAYTYDVNATDPDDDTLTYSLVTKPTAMTIISATGLIKWTPTAEGDYAVVVKVSDGALDIIQSFTIVVSKPGAPPCPPAPPAVKLISIVVVPKEMTLFVGETEAIESVTAYYSDGSTKDIPLGSCIYLSDTTGVATVDTGVITAVSEGTAAITVSYKTKKDTVAVTVNPVLLDHIVVLPETMTLFVGEKKGLKSITAHYNDGSTAAIPVLTMQGGTPACEYKSDDELVATVTITGLIEAVGEGTATITATYQGKTDKLLVTVNPVLLDHIVVEPDEVTLTSIPTLTKISFIGSTQQLEVTAYYDDGNHGDVTSKCIYVSGDSQIAFVDVSGLVVGKGFGLTTITVSYTEGRITEEATVEVTVGPVHNVTQDFYRNTITDTIDDELTEDGDTIEVSPGTYLEEITVNVEGLTIRGENLDTIVDGGFILEADNITIDGLTIKNGFGSPRAIFTKSTSSPTGGSKGHQIINNDIVHGNVPFGAGKGYWAINIVACATEPVNIVVDNNKIYGWRVAIMLEGYGTTITNNELYDNVKSGIEVEDSCDNEISYNSIYNNGEYGICFGEDETTGNVVNYNNIYGNVDFGVLNDSTSSVDATNNWWGNGGTGVNAGKPGEDGNNDVSVFVNYTPWLTTQY